MLDSFTLLFRCFPYSFSRHFRYFPRFPKSIEMLHVSHNPIISSNSKNVSNIFVNNKMHTSLATVQLKGSDRSDVSWKPPANRWQTASKEPVPTRFQRCSDPVSTFPHGSHLAELPKELSGCYAGKVLIRFSDQKIKQTHVSKCCTCFMFFDFSFFQHAHKLTHASVLLTMCTASNVSLCVSGIQRVLWKVQTQRALKRNIITVIKCVDDIRPQEFVAPERISEQMLKHTVDIHCCSTQLIGFRQRFQKIGE